MNATDATVYGGSLFAATSVARRERPQLTFDLDVDVCVIGGGLAGLTAARELALRGRSVVLLEARRLAWNASGRNTGFVLPGFQQSPEEVVARVGKNRARELWALAQIGLDYVRDSIRDANMPGIVPIEGWLDVSKIDAGDRIATKAAFLRGEFGLDTEFWPTERVRSQLKTRRYFQAIHYPSAFHIHPLNYALGLAAAAEQAGARIFEDTPALSIDPAGVRKRVVTPNARVRAAHIVLAGNMHLGALMPDLARTLFPITTYLVATAPLGERLKDAIVYRGGVSDSDWADNHYRVTEDDRLIWLGRLTTWRSDAGRFVRRLRADIKRVFPQLGKVEIEYRWSGTGGTTVHHMPQVGEVAPGLWVASGFGGHGINTTAMAGILLARAIGEGDDTWRLFTPFELVWAGGGIGRALVQVSYWIDRFRSGNAAMRSRWRERAAEKAALLAQAKIAAEKPDQEPQPEPGAGTSVAEAAKPPADAPADARREISAHSGQRARSRKRRMASADPAGARERPVAAAKRED